MAVILKLIWWLNLFLSFADFLRCLRRFPLFIIADSQSQNIVGFGTWLDVAQLCCHGKLSYQILSIVLSVFFSFSSYRSNSFFRYLFVLYVSFGRCFLKFFLNLSFLALLLDLFVDGILIEPGVYKRHQPFVLLLLHKSMPSCECFV